MAVRAVSLGRCCWVKYARGRRTADSALLHVSCCCCIGTSLVISSGSSTPALIIVSRRNAPEMGPRLFCNLRAPSCGYHFFLTRPNGFPFRFLAAAGVGKPALILVNCV